MSEGLARTDCGGCERQARESREGFCTCPGHDRRAMVFNGALTDAEIRGDILARMPRKHEVHDLMLARREAGNMLRGSLLPSRPFI